MLAQWCFTAWYIAIGRPNWMRSFEYAAASSVHSKATPTASADSSTRAMSTSVRLAPVNTTTGASASVTRALRRLGSRFGGVDTVTPDADASTTTTSSPTGSRMTFATPPLTTTAEPLAVEPLTDTAPDRANPPTDEPSTRPGSSRALVASSA